VDDVTVAPAVGSQISPALTPIDAKPGQSVGLIEVSVMVGNVESSLHATTVIDTEIARRTTWYLFNTVVTLP
jgi:hypothetical protein